MRDTRWVVTALLALVGALMVPGMNAQAACSTTGTAGDDVIVCDGTTPDKVFGFDGNDTITNNGTISSGGIDGGGGNDTITNNGFISASVDGGPGNDVIINNGDLAGGFGLDGGSGTNTIYNNGSVDFIIAGGGGAGTVIIGPNADGQAGINGDGDDTLCFNNGADLTGKSAAGDSVTVGAETYTWNNFGTLATNCAVPAGAAGGASGSDERLNPEPGAPVVVWCRAAGVEVYTVDRVTSEGVFAFRATPATVEAGLTTAATTGINATIESNGGATLYALTSGELQVNGFLPTGEIYAFIFDAAACQQAFSSTTSAPAVTSGVTPLNVPDFSAPITGEATLHTVQRGETLYRIARRYGMSWPELAAVNGIDNPDRIYAGQILYIPPR